MVKSIIIVIKHAPKYAINCIILGIINSASVFILAKLNSIVMDELLLSIMAYSFSLKLMISLILITLFNILIIFLRSLLDYISLKSTSKYSNYMTLRIIEKTDKLEYSYFDDPTMQNKLKQYINDSVSVLNAYTNCVQLFFNAITLITSFIISFKFSWVITIATVLIAIPSYYIRKQIKEGSYEFEKNMNTTERKVDYFKNIFFANCNSKLQ